jgi:bleomycin hydrolase
MGNTESTPQLPASSRRERRIDPKPAPVMSLDEKFDAFKIDHGDRQPIEHSIFTSSDPEHVDASGTERYVRELLKDPKNRLGLSALSTYNPSAVLEKPRTVVKDTQIYNVSIPFEGSPVTNQRSSGRCWIFAACNVFRVAIQQKYNIKSFELSQSYLFY